MLRLARSLIRFGARQAKPLVLSQELMEDIRQQIYQSAVRNYELSYRSHEDRVYEEHIYGRNCYVVGITPDSYQSNTYIKSVLTSLNPSHIIMGGFNNSRLISSKLAQTAEDKNKVRACDFYIQPSKLYCKSMVTPMITNKIQKNPNYHVEKDTDGVQYADRTNKHLHALNYFTIMNSLHYKEFTKLSFGMPSDIILFQDLMINQSLTDLRDVFDKVIQALRDNKNQYGQKQRTSEYRPQIIQQQMSYHALFHPRVYQKQVTYTTALLNKFASFEEKVALFVDNRFVQQIAENVHKISIQPTQVFRQGCTSDLGPFIKNSDSQSGAKIQGYLNASDKNAAINQLIQKFVILSYLKDRALRIQIQSGYNIFLKTVFKSLFQNLSNQQLKSRYENAKKKYQTIISSVMYERLMNVKYYKNNQKQFYTLSEMIKTQEQRNIDYPISLQIQNKQMIKQQKALWKQINKTIQQIMKKQLPESQKKQMQMYFSGNFSRENIVLYQKLLVQAKIRLKKENFKLPIYHHTTALTALFKDQLKGHILHNNSQFLNQKLAIKKFQDLKKKGTVREIHNKEQLDQFMNSGRMIFSIDKDGQQFMPPLSTDEQYQQYFRKTKTNESQLLKQIYQLVKQGRQKVDEQIQQRTDQKHENKNNSNNTYENKNIKKKKRMGKKMR